MISRCCPLSIQSLLVVLAAQAHMALATGFLRSPAAAASADEKVMIELYYESQCPGCRELITTSFKDAFQKEGFLDMADVTFVPFGNARETKSASGTYEFECQHGPSECMYNTIEACALDKIDDPMVAFQVIDCIERSDESRDPDQDYYDVAMKCANLAKVDDVTIAKTAACTLGSEGIQLDHDAATKTNALDPPHEYVPYLVVNGVHSDDTQNAISESLFDYVCDAYLGPNKSPACSTTRSETKAISSKIVKSYRTKMEATSTEIM